MCADPRMVATSGGVSGGAERGRLVVVEMDQPLGRRDDGRYAPIGGWSITHVRVHPARDVVRRIGDVP